MILPDIHVLLHYFVVLSNENMINKNAFDGHTVLPPLWIPFLFVGEYCILLNLVAETNNVSCRSQRQKKTLSTKWLTTLPKTNMAPENGWLEYVGILVSFWDGLFSGAMLVSGLVNGGLNHFLFHPSFCKIAPLANNFSDGLKPSPG